MHHWCEPFIGRLLSSLSISPPTLVSKGVKSLALDAYTCAATPLKIKWGIKNL
jgi:hypothetical protein